MTDTRAENRRLASPKRARVAHKDEQASVAKGPILDHNRTVSALIIILSNKLTAGSSQIYRKRFRLGTIEWRAMALLAIEPWVTAQRISQVTGQDKAGVSRALKTLQKRGFVLTRQNHRNARSVEMALTRSGLAMHNKIVRVAHRREERLLAGLSQADIAALIGTLKTLHRAVPYTNALLHEDDETAEGQE